VIFCVTYVDSMITTVATMAKIREVDVEDSAKHHEKRANGVSSTAISAGPVMNCLSFCTLLRA